MYMLQLFDVEDEAQPLGARLLREGALRIGRDAAADWPITDPDCALSRLHCELLADSAGLTLLPRGTNGVFDDADGERFPNDMPVALPVPGAFRLGRFRIVASHAPYDNVSVEENRTLVLTPPLGASVEVPGDWMDGGSPEIFNEGSLLEAFCQGAGLDVSMLSTEEPAEIMRRAGAVYRQMVLGIGDLMAERDRARARFQLTRTTIGGTGNNPFKWAPTQRLALDLLLAGSAGFLSGPAALKASFRDIKRHLVATFAGLQGSLIRAVDSFDPAAIDRAVEGKGSLLKSRAMLQMNEVTERHADLRRQLDSGEMGSLDQAFVDSYDAADAETARLSA